MPVLHNALKRSVQSIEEHCLTGRLSNALSLQLSEMLPCSLRYCADIVNAKNVSVVKHRLSVTRPCRRCFEILNKIQTMNI